MTSHQLVAAPLAEGASWQDESAKSPEAVVARSGGKATKARTDGMCASITANRLVILSVLSFTITHLMLSLVV